MCLLLIGGRSYAKDSSYEVDFINKSPFYKKDAKMLKRFFSSSYLNDKEGKRLSQVAKQRLDSITKQMVNEINELLKKNPVYLIEWPSEKNLILKYVKEIEEKKRE